MLQSELPEITSCANYFNGYYHPTDDERYCYEKSEKSVTTYFTALGLLLFFITAAASAQNAEQLAEKALAATVYLEMADKDDNILGSGSGFFVGQSQIATNFHIVEGASKGTAKLAGSPTKYTVDGISATDAENDLAILKVTGFEGEPLPLGDSDTVKTDEIVYVAGNPERTGRHILKRYRQ